MNKTIWISAAVCYGLFLSWYFNWSGPLNGQEIDKAMAAFEASTGSEYTDLDDLRAFLEEDDGKEIVMANLVRLHQEDVPHPVSGDLVPPATVVGEYFEPFMKAMFLRGGHPVYQAGISGGYIDSWNVDADPRFGIAMMVRYRSRRDMVELFANPIFSEMHVYKFVAIEKTASFPTQISFSTFLQPKYWVPGLLLLMASLAQNVALLLGRSRT
jgi:hypothetical protein